MSYKPDEGTMIAYLYGELDATEIEKVENYLAKHPEEKVSEMINHSLAKNNESLASQWSEEQKKLMQSVANLNSREIDALVKNASQASQDQVRSFVSGLQEQNLKLMKDYLQLSSTD